MDALSQNQNVIHEIEQYRRIIETMSDGLIVHDQSGQIIRFNPAALTILGLTEDQLLGRTSMDPRWKAVREDGSEFPGETHPAMVALKTGVAQTGVMMGIEVPDKGRRWLRINASPCQHNAEAAAPSDVAIREVVVTFSDVTDVMAFRFQTREQFGNASDLMCVAGMDGYIKKVNAAALRITGFSEAELCARPFLQFIHPDDLLSAMKELEQLSQGKSTLLFEARVRRKDETYRIITWTIHPDTRAGLLFGVGRDVTEQRRSEEAFKQIMTALNETAIVAFTDPRGQITQVNDNFCRISGYSRAELIGQNHRIVNSGHHPKTFFKDMWSRISSGRSWTADVCNRAKNGKPYWVRTVIAPLMDSEKNVLQYVSIRFEVTAQKTAEMKNVELLSQLELAQATARIGSWEFEIAPKQMSWSTEQYKIFEIPQPQPSDELFHLYRSRIHPDDVARFDALIARACTAGENFSFRHSLIAQDGRVRHVQCVANVRTGDNGLPQKLTGTCQDITERVQKDQELSFIFEALRIGVWQFSPLTRMFQWDTSMCRLYGVPEDSFKGDFESWTATLTPETRMRAVQDFELALMGKKELDSTFEINSTMTGTRTIASIGKVMRTEAGDPVMVYGVSYDRTAQAVVEIERKRLLDENQAILKSARFSIITTTLDGTIASFNKEAENILGYSAMEVIGKTKMLMFHDPNEISAVSNIFSKQLHVKIPVGFQTFTIKANLGEFDERQWTYIRKDGSKLQVKLNVTALRSKDGKLYGYMGIARDLTEELRQYEIIEEQRLRMISTAKLASLGELSAGIAHEINNPLAIITGAAARLERLREDQAKFSTKVSAIQRSCERIAKIVSGLKRFSRSDDDATHAPCVLNKIVRETAALVENKSQRSAVPVELNIQSDALISCDEVEIEQVIVNLVNNAIDAVKNLSEKWVRVHLFEEGQDVVLHVRDSGNGIPKQIVDKLFNPFFTTKPVGEGTGLGLSIAKGILDQHGASIEIKVNDPHTCFEIRFPKLQSASLSA